ncbi:uncharacterized protein LOC116159482 [Photinus pyralis]|uniref:Pentacotripeptide-repeat region of PRORP domain-containing protein n=1 Tax=Photinus pyralis TaxID=7054 RepID=A0A1Y1LMW4_PHOPY|nr:uncharacterized protein LOC116159482 [Photinus pyralis]
MALSISPRISLIILKHLYFPRLQSINLCFCNLQPGILAFDSDALENFTTQLMQRKVNKWESGRMKQNLRSSPLSIKFATKQSVAIDVTAVDGVLRDALEVDDKDCITSALDECMKFRVLPDMANLLQAFSFFAHAGDKAMVLKLIELSKLLNEDTLVQYSYFKHYLAEATWAKGNVSEAILLFEEVYAKNLYLRRRIRSMLNSLVSDSIRGRSEAVLLLILSFAKRLGEIYKDFYPLACIWRCCILSEWFTDQSIALELLEHNEDLRKIVTKHVPIIVYVALREHQLDLVYRILEVLLRCESKAHYATIIEMLFDYRVKQRDLQGCTKIVQWCEVHGITLAMFQQEQYINLLCSSPTSNQPSEKPARPRPHSYNFKF